MPQYFFTVLHGPQNEGLDLPNDDAAWVEATTACGELLRDLNGHLKPGEHWSMQVKDENGNDLYLLEFRTAVGALPSEGRRAHERCQGK
jgi:hypothetical protein